MLGTENMQLVAEMDVQGQNRVLVAKTCYKQMVVVQKRLLVVKNGPIWWL